MCLFLSVPARAQGTPNNWRARVEARIGPGGAGEVVVNDIVILRLRLIQGYHTPLQRAEITAQRLRSVIASGLTPETLQVDTTTDKKNPRLKAFGQVIASVDKDEAKASASTPVNLIRDWASSLRKALAIPGLALTESNLLLPLNETRPISVTGAARGPVSVTLSSGADATTNNGDNRVVNVQVDENTGMLTLYGTTPGRETLTISREGATATLYIAVQPYAGRFDTPRAVTITGRNPEPTMIARLAAVSAVNAAVPNPGATATVATDALTLSVPPSGETRTVNVPVTLSGREMIPVKRTISVSVSNQALAPVETTTLFYSNNPERVTGFGTLFLARLAQSTEATRLLYHHQSAMGQAAWFTVELINDKDQPVRVQAVGGSAGPVLDTVWVGYRAASDFVRDYLSDSGAIHTIPPKSRFALTAMRLPAGQTISGLTQLRLIDGPAPLVRVAADVPRGATSIPSELQPYSLTEAEISVGDTFVLSEHVYSDPVKRLTATYTVGGTYAFINVGKEPLASRGAEQKLFGNYGVFYEIDVKMINPTDRETKVHIIFEPAAGMAGGIFLLDDKRVEIAQTNLPSEPELGVFVLAPGETRNVKLRTVPLSGSNYPIRIIVRP